MSLPMLITAAVLLLAALLAGFWLGSRAGRARGEAEALQARRPLEEALAEARTQLALAAQAGSHAQAQEARAVRACEELQQQRAGLEAERLRLEGELQAARTQAEERDRLREEASSLRQELSAARGRVVELETAAAKDREALVRERQQLEEGRALLRQEFENLAHQIFEGKQAVFEARSREGLSGLLAPFKEQLESFRQRVDQVHTENVQGHASLRGELERLRALNQQITEEASNLTRALKGDKKAQGTWGEQKVELLLEQAGLRQGFEYAREQNFKDEEGRNARPDFVVNLPEGKHIIIDSKVSLVDYAACVAAETPEERQQHLAAHVAALRAHIRTLSDRNYPELLGMDSPDFTFLFVAIEPAYLAAVEHSPTLFQEAYDRRIALVTATTLLPVLRVVANLWSLQRRNQSTQVLAEQAGRVYEKLRIFVEKMERLGHQLETAQNTYKDSFNTLKDGRGSLTRTVDRFVELGVKVTRRLPASVGGGALPELAMEEATDAPEA